MTKYHVNTAGEPGVCKARKHCPYGLLDADHYSSAEEARRSFELENTTREHIFSGAVKEVLEEIGPRQLPNSAYSVLDRAMYYNRYSEHELTIGLIALQEEQEKLANVITASTGYSKEEQREAAQELKALGPLQERF